VESDPEEKCLNALPVFRFLEVAEIVSLQYEIRNNSGRENPS
jgi:hypothetical protein